jgi:hypothetical protein
MERHDLTHEQARNLQDRLYPVLNFLARLRDRMERRGFERGDELFRLAAEANEAVRKLRANVHLMSCRSGVGEPPRKLVSVVRPWVMVTW